jgi:hypothetical protein
MILIYQEDRTKLCKLEKGISQFTGLEFTGEKNRISTELPILTYGVFYTQLIFEVKGINLEVTIHERCSEKEGLLGGQSNYEFAENFDYLYICGVKLKVKTQSRLTLETPEMYDGLKPKSSFELGWHTFRLRSPEMSAPATDWGIINLCTFLLAQIPGFRLPEVREDKVVEFSPEKELAAVS